MKKNQYTSVYAQCCFYRCESKQAVYCDGLTDKCRIRLSFESAEAKKEYIKSFCHSRYMSCPIAQMLNGLWEDEA